jgi:hypothetical protein
MLQCSANSHAGRFADGLGCPVRHLSSLDSCAGPTYNPHFPSSHPLDRTLSSLHPISYTHLKCTQLFLFTYDTATRVHRPHLPFDIAILSAYSICILSLLEAGVKPGEQRT